MNAMGGRRKVEHPATGSAGSSLEMGVIGKSVIPLTSKGEYDPDLSGEVFDPTLPRKASKLQFIGDRTANRHR